MGQKEVLSFYRNPPFAHAACASVLGGARPTGSVRKSKQPCPNSDGEHREKTARKEGSATRFMA